MKKGTKFRTFIVNHRYGVNEYCKEKYNMDIDKELGRLATKFEKQSIDLQNETVRVMNSLIPDREAVYDMIVDLTYQL